MAFKIKDLIIDIVQAGGGLCGPATKPAEGAGLCGPATKIAPVAALCGPATRFVDLAGLCGPATKIAELVPVATAVAAAAAAGRPTPTAGPEELAALKKQLRDALACIEEGERHEEHGLPRTRAEADQLEEKLRAALGELAELKKGLKS
jgi:hypothetical protein